MAQQVPVVGTIYNPDDANYRPRFTQPGGPGTMTFPQQAEGEKLGLFVFPFCQHWSNQILVKRAAVGGIASAICCCPLCDMCVRIITPYDLIYQFQNEILLV